MTDNVRAISFVLCPACIGGRKIRIRFPNDNVLEIKNTPTYQGYDMEYPEITVDQSFIEIPMAHRIMATPIIRDWMSGSHIFQGFDY